MVPSQKDQQDTGRRGGFLAELAHLEAPDRNFVGHRDIITRNLARYHFVSKYVHGEILDIGCGRGYGFEILAPYSHSCKGIDISHSFIQESLRTYPNIPVVQASGHAPPFVNESFDAIIAFEVIEHIEDDVSFLFELKRLARRDAFIAISTPNRLISSGNSVKPLNPFHVREYTTTEFQILIRSVFPSAQFFGQKERSKDRVLGDSLIDRIPIKWKYLLPTDIQGRISVALRTPLSLDDCLFLNDDIDRAHTFLALCHL